MPAAPQQAAASGTSMYSPRDLRMVRGSLKTDMPLRR